MTTMTRPGPNDLEPCPSRSARVRHAAHGSLCPICDAGADDYVSPDAHPARIEVSNVGPAFPSPRALARVIQPRRLALAPDGAA